MLLEEHGGSAWQGRDLPAGRPGGLRSGGHAEPHQRGRQTHFLSWCWGYRLSAVQGALRLWIEDTNAQQGEERRTPDSTFLWMCFFMNNQHRMLRAKTEEDTDTRKLCETFKENLKRIGRVVAILDDWNDPWYLTRVWTIFEQYSAMSAEIPVTMVLPPRSDKELVTEIRQGDAGLKKVREELSKVHVQDAKASVAKDEESVKQLIEEDVGFKTVNGAVKSFLVVWAANRFRAYMQQLVEQVEADHAPMLSSMGPLLDSETAGSTANMRRPLVAPR